MAVYVDQYAKALYAAEKGVPSGTVFNSMDECRAFAESVVRSDWWKTNAPSVKALSVFSTKSENFSFSRAARADIHLAHWGWNQRVILHEMAHVLVSARHAGYHGHDGLFVFWLRQMISEFMGATALQAFVEGCLGQGLNPLDRATEAVNENRNRLLLATVENTNSNYVRLTQEIYSTHVPVAQVHRAVVAHGRSLSSFVKAFGGNKSLNEPLNEHWRITYAGGQRWLPLSCLDRIDVDLKLASPRAGVARRYY